MTDSVLCRLFLCKNPKCGKPMRLPLDTLSQLIVDPEDPSKDALSIAVLCHRCSQIGTYSLAANSSDRFGADRLVSRDQAEDMSPSVWLKCAVETCTPRTPLTVTLTPASDRAEGYIGRELTSLTMEWHKLFCANGHPIPYPQPSL